MTDAAVTAEPEFDLSKLDIQTVGRLELTEDTLLIIKAPDYLSAPSHIAQFQDYLDRFWNGRRLKGNPLVVPHGTIIVGVAQEADSNG